MNFVTFDWVLVAAGVAALVAAGGALLWRYLRPSDPQEIERKRRSYLNQVGRIVEGEIVEIAEAPAADSPAGNGGLFRRRRAARAGAVENGGRKLVFYSYEISGVTYETAQDVTGLEERLCLDRAIAGQPISVKYDPANPGNSILVADNWSGVH